MSLDAEHLSLIGELDDASFDVFKAAVKTLLSRTFIVRGEERGDEVYDFAVRNVRLLEAYFACADMEIRRDETLGVVACRGGSETRMRLGREETCALLVLRLLFEEKRSELSLAGHPSVLVVDFVQRYRAVVGEELKKTRLESALRKLASSRLIRLPADPTDPDGAIVLYPSLAMALDREGIDEILAAVAKEIAAGEAEG